MKQSEVFKHLNTESMKTREELEAENALRWTTFLQKPNRPIPKSRAQIEHERREELERQLQQDMAAKKAAAEAEERAARLLRAKTPEVVEQPEQTADAEEAERGAVALGVCCDGVHCGTPPGEECPNCSQSDADTAAAADANETETDESAAVADADAGDEVRETTPQPPKTAEELLVEKKLSDIQQQLLALSVLPVTIQATLDAVSRQLSDLLPSLGGKSMGDAATSEGSCRCCM